MGAEKKVLELLRQCWLRGVILTLNGGKLSFKASKGAMDQALLAEVRENKSGMIEALKTHPNYFSPRPLSLNERALWFLYRMNPDSSAYNMAYSVKLNASATPDDIQSAFNQLLARHSILSHAYGERDGDPVQWMSSDFVAPTVSVLTLTNGNQKQIQGWISREADRPLKLEEGHVCRGSILVNKTSDEYVSYFTMVIHHIAADFISFEVLRSELLKLLQGESLDDSEPAASEGYRDWSSRQLSVVRNGETDEVFWLEQLDNLPQLTLPTDFPHSTKTGSDGEEISFLLPENQASQLREQCRAFEVTPYVWWMSAFQWFMSRLSGQDDFIIGTPSSGRLSVEDAKLVGYFVNPLALRCRPAPDLSFERWVAVVAEQTKNVMAHQAYPFAALVEKLNVKREAGRSPVFQHMFTLNHERPEANISSIVEEELLAEQRGAAHELNLVVVDNRSAFLGKWRYNDSLFRRSTVESIRDSFLHFVGQLLQDQTKTLKALKLATEKNASTLSGRTLAPMAETAWQAFVQICENSPGNIALHMGERKVSYGELMRLVDSAAIVLNSRGVNKRDRVGICLERSVEQVVAILACWRIGATYVAMDPKWPENRLAFIAGDAKLSALISFEYLQSSKTAWQLDTCEQIDVTQLTAVESESQQSGKNVDFQGTFPRFDDLIPSAELAAYVIYTSGSTGQPKGVEVSQSNLIHYVTGVLDRLQLSKHASLASLASSGADLSYTAVFGALLSGRTLRLLDEDLAFDAEALADELARESVDCLKIVPSHLNGILLATSRSEWLPSQALITGGEAISPELLMKVTERQPSLSVFNHYGPTETTVGVIAKKLDLYDDSIALGKPLANVSIRVVDGFNQVVPQGFAGELEISGPTLATGYLGQPALTEQRFSEDSNGVRWYRTGDKVKLLGGELFFVGRSDFQIKIRGYRVEPGEVESWLKQHANDAVVLNVPDERQNNRLVAYIVTDGSGSNTSPLHSFDDLKSRMLKALPDYMVPTVWVPLNSLPLLGNGKADRNALPDPDVYSQTLIEQNAKEESESSSQSLSATEQTLLDIWQTLLGKPELTVEDNFFANGGDSILGLQIIAKAKQAGITLTPKAIFEHQTVTELAKVAVVPEVADVSTKAASLTEQTLLDIAKEVLGKGDLKATDNFFAVGGDSILSLQIIAKAKQSGITMSPKQVFEHQTMAELAAAVQLDSDTADANTIQNVDKSLNAVHLNLPQMAFALTPIQAWFFEQQNGLNSNVSDQKCDEQNLAHWNQSLLLNSKLDLNVSALRRAAMMLVERHPSLRLAFFKEDDVWLQQYQSIDLNWADRLVLECHEKTERDHPNNELLTRLQSDFRLDHAPLIKFVWLSASKQLLCAAHHLIMDAISWQVLLEDFFALYTQAESGLGIESGSRISANTARFDEWQDYLSKQLETLDFQAANAYWQSQIQPLLPKVEHTVTGSVNHGYHVCQNTYQNSANTQVSLSKELTKRLLSTANDAYNTRVQELLVTALAKVLGQWQQLTDITVELEGHGREPGNSGLDLSSSVGWFTSRFPQRLSAVADWETALIHNKEQLRRMPEKGLEYGLLRYLSAESDSQILAPNAHSFVSFNYLGQQDNINSDAPFELATPLCPGMKSASALRSHLLDINAMVLNGNLTVEWTYPSYANPELESVNAYRCVPDLAERFLQALNDLIEHCCEPDSGRATAIDFPDAELTDTEFLDLLAELEA